MNVDYKELLAKYIEHVGASEGITFIDHLYKAESALYEGMSDKVKFSEEEMAALRECEQKYVGPA